MSYRPELPPVPQRMRHLPIRRGYPVPWFVAMVDGDYHFPTADAAKLRLALRKRLCWVCGERTGKNMAFVIGPMCAVNRNTSEPPCHRECAIFSATACPFLVRPKMKRTKDIPAEATDPAGLFIDRNPGVACVWVTQRFKPRAADGGVLFQLGDPDEVLWFCQGRTATRAEILESIDSGYPILHNVALGEGMGAVEELKRYYYRAMQYVPA